MVMSMNIVLKVLLFEGEKMRCCQNAPKKPKYLYNVNN